MLPKKNKFTSGDFSKLKTQKTKKIHTNIGFFVVLQGSKKAIIVSKKVFKTAVLRNKYKRLYFNTLLEFQKVENQVEKLSFVFHPKKTFTKEELLEAFKTVSVL